ncbi:pyridoxine/pyridoxamine 5'-phosphate oxidase, partial [Paracoccus haematequi]|uniref:pyridoxine/pyridoxamine 5'-phosphate oxidase n=1 Tax=Paracoccus haematequi TaxID=2491866 RepID=UPI000F7DA1FA
QQFIQKFLGDRHACFLSVKHGPDHSYTEDRTLSWHFAIKAESPKARQIMNDPHVALTFYWPALARQIRIRGVANLLPAAEYAADYLDRPKASRASALASRQSEVLSDAGELNRKLIKAEEFIAENLDYVAPGWQVYAVAPHIVEFWQGASDRNHKRLQFSPSVDSSSWTKERLWP